MSMASDGAIRILNVIDDFATRTLVTRALQHHGMSVTSSGREGLAEHLRRNDLDLIILDLRQSRSEKLGLLCQILSVFIPVMITDDHRCVESDRVAVLELGADDDMTEPIAPRELVARVRCILRRRGRTRPTGPDRPARSVYRFGDLTLNVSTRNLTRPDGARIFLSSREYALLLVFLNNPDRTLTREQLVRMTRQHHDASDRSIDVLVLRLRRKLESHPGSQRVIETKRGAGYVLKAAVERL